MMVADDECLEVGEFAAARCSSGSAAKKLARDSACGQLW
jgi:hypothetical protein